MQKLLLMIIFVFWGLFFAAVGFFVIIGQKILRSYDEFKTCLTAGREKDRFWVEILKISSPGFITGGLILTDDLGLKAGFWRILG